MLGKLIVAEDKCIQVLLVLMPFLLVKRVQISQRAVKFKNVLEFDVETEFKLLVWDVLHLLGFPEYIWFGLGRVDGHLDEP